MSKMPSVLIIAENLTLPLDRRVWQEATTLRDAGYTVSVICPRGGKYTASYELLDGIHIFRHPLPIEADGPLGYACEYSTALFWEFLLTWRVYFKVGFDVIQACNPPDLMFLIAGFWKAFFGKPFVFDHHDINPELYEAKFGRRGFMHKLLLALERATFRTADVALATNESYRDIALGRGGMSPERVFIVRSIPDLASFKRTEPTPELRNGRKHVIGYLGIMGAQDGVDNLIRAMDHLVNQRKRQDLQAVLVGRGTEVPRLERMIRDMRLQDYVTLTGYLPTDKFLSAISTFDIGVVPDPNNPFNDKCSMNKVFEYMALGIPVVGFDLTETIRSAGDAALYARNNDAIELATHIATLCDDPEKHRKLGEEGQRRAQTLLRWDGERQRLLAAYNLALGQGRTTPVSATVAVGSG